MEYRVGIDLGGTNVAVGVVDENKQIIARASIKTRPERMLDDVIYETNVPNGYIIPVAKTVTNPAILLESERFTQMIEHCRQRFGVVLIDTPPLGSVADAMNIATHCDGTVLVVRGGETPRKVVGDSVQQLKRTGVPLLGVVLDRAEMNSKSSLYYKRYYKSGYYYKGYGSEKSQPVQK